MGPLLVSAHGTRRALTAAGLAVAPDWKPPASFHSEGLSKPWPSCTMDAAQKGKERTGRACMGQSMLLNERDKTTCCVTAVIMVMLEKTKLQ